MSFSKRLKAIPLASAGICEMDFPEGFHVAAPGDFEFPLEPFYFPLSLYFTVKAKKENFQFLTIAIKGTFYDGQKIKPERR